MNFSIRALLLALLVLAGFLQTYGQVSGQSPSNQSPNEQLVQEIEKQFFPGHTLSEGFSYQFSVPFEQVRIKAKDGIGLHALLFKAAKGKGVIFYLHGSQGGLDTWGKLAPTYTALGYDILMLDYRGYGKSEGKVTSEQQVHQDVQLVYDYLKHHYPEEKIIILGQSMGSGPAARLAAANHPQKLILQAPYYSIRDWIEHLVPDLDPAVVSAIRYQFNTYEYVTMIKSPIVIFHGDADEAIYFGASQKLSALLKPADMFIPLKGETHTDFTHNKDYLAELKAILK